jgi:uncharacterized protein (DUF433 family)
MLETRAERRRPAGTGLGVWEVIRDYRAGQKDPRVLRKSLPQLSQAQIKACLLYYARYPQEIDAQIAENAALTREAVRARISTLGIDA